MKHTYFCTKNVNLKVLIKTALRSVIALKTQDRTFLSVQAQNVKGTLSLWSGDRKSREKRKIMNTLKIRQCSEHDSQSTVSNEQNHPNNSDSDSETEANTSQTMPVEPVPDRDMKSIDADYNQPTPNNSSGEMERQSSESECEKGKDQQDREVLWKNRDSNPETEANTSQTVPDEPVPDRDMKSIDADHNQPTPNNSSGEMERQSSESECEKGKTSKIGKFSGKTVILTLRLKQTPRKPCQMNLYQIEI
ncbi:uncharacterized protein LOC131534709 isoform X2 [Onychostoma macrolepis]|uniref:uncharacterized protein LOC131534709 isoform X2 n=1 Tax=Onychostoma macrolepis TaxID=369639 RepID=UPI00272D6E99|nr:uncharacterized protein LOC131534709 isoform X2 [Onychostoma macrolepis]